jgi:hypothetical protein
MSRSNSTNKTKDDFKDRVQKKGKGGRNRNTKYDKANLDSTNRDNDPNWYFSNKELADQAAQLSFQNVLGLTPLCNYQVPTIARIKLASTPGTTYNVPNIASRTYKFQSLGSVRTRGYVQEGKAGVNLMAAKLYTLLSTFSGRTSAYAPQDVAQMILAISSIAEVSEAIRRTFGVALTYNYRNRMLPLGLMASMGVDPFDMVSHLSEYRMRFNVAMSRINQIPLLDNIGYIRKARDIYQNVYMDDPTSMAQLFFYIPEFIWYLREDIESTGSILTAVDLPRYDADYADKGTMADWLEMLEKAITYVLESSTLNFIYADLLNMSTKLKTPTWQFDYLAENYVVMPIYNQNALLQFHNLTVIDKPATFYKQTPSEGVDRRGSLAVPIYGQQSDGSVYVTNYFDVLADPDKNDVVFNPIWWNPNTIVSSWAVVDMPTDSPTLEDRIEALRFMVCDSNFVGSAADLSGIYVPGDFQYFAVFRALPDHVCVGLDIISKFTTDPSVSEGVEYLRIDRTFNPAASMQEEMPAKLSQFEHAPAYVEVGPNSNNIIYLYDQLQFYTEIDYTYLKRLNDLVTIGLFDFRV